MKIVVLVKEVPDTYGERKLDLETGLADRGASEAVLDEIVERAIEAALVTAENVGDSEVVVVTMGPESATTSARKALAMGAASAVHVVDDDLVGADLTLTSETLAAVLRDEGFDLVVAGSESSDGGGGVIPAMLGEHLGVAVATRLDEFAVTDGAVTGSRTVEHAVQHVRAILPAIISVSERLPEARFPSFKGIMAAKKKPYRTVSLSDLGVNPLPSDRPRAIMTEIAERPPRQAGTKIDDDGDAGTKIADFLVSERLV